MDKNELHLVFIDLEKAYDRVYSREILLKVLENKEIRIVYIQAIKNMYEGLSTGVRTQGRYKQYSHKNRVGPRFNPKPLSFYFIFGCTYGIYLRASTETYVLFQMM